MIDLDAAAERRITATTLRKRGDALQRHAGDKRDAGNHDGAADLERRAAESFRGALASLDSALRDLKVAPPGRQPPTEPASPADPIPPGWASDVADTLGSRGGILTRLDRPHDALSSYQTGALIERAYDLSTTYCRGNVVRLSVQLGVRGLVDMTDEIQELRDALSARMSSPTGDPPDLWAYADLGDYQLMLNDVEAARSTYANFARQAGTGSTEKTWNALRSLAAVLGERGDPDAHRFAQAVEQVRPILNPKPSTP